MKSPFKFLDSYTKEDREIFFGREREIEELYHRVFESKIMLVYGVSGTGKSSLINCGLANKFSETDWLPLNIRRGGNILESLAAAINSAAITKQTVEIVTPNQFKRAVRSLYLDHYKPVYFIFDQFEELFIFGNKEEKKAVVQVIKTLVESEIQCRFIFVMREEYMAGITEFEKSIPTIFSNRVRIEKMAHINAIEAIKGPCKVSNIDLEEGFAEALLEKLSPESADVELTYLQVFLDRILRLASENYPPFRGGQGGHLQGGAGGADITIEEGNSISFTLPLLSRVGNVSDLLGSFLDEQISLLNDPDTGLAVLKSFVSIKGTKKQMNSKEVSEYSQTLGKSIADSALLDMLQTFVNLRILRDKDQNEKYELRHDGLATKIFDKITLVEREILEIRQYIENAYHNWQKRKLYLSPEDLNYISPYESRLFLPKELGGFIIESKNELGKVRRRKRNIVYSSTMTIVIVLTGFTIWALIEKRKADEASLKQLESVLTLNDNFERIKENQGKRLQEIIDLIEARLMENPANVMKLFNKAVKINRSSNELKKFINNLQYNLISDTEKSKPDSVMYIDLKKIKNKMNSDIPEKILFKVSDQKDTSNILRLKKKILDFKSTIYSQIDKKDWDKIQFNLKTDKTFQSSIGDSIPWEKANFSNITVAGAFTNLNSLITEINYIEIDATLLLYSWITSDRFNFDVITTVVQPLKPIVYLGQNYEADVILTAYNSKQNMEAYLSKDKSFATEAEIENPTNMIPLISKNGRIRLKIPANKPGINYFGGFISMKRADGSSHKVLFRDKYYVGNPSVVVSPINKNFLYFGVDNPIDIEVSGVTSDKINVSAENGNIRMGNGCYIIKPTSMEDCSIQVKVLKEDGSSSLFSTLKFKIKNKPNPIASIKGLQNDRIDRTKIAGINELTVSFTSDFDFGITFKVTQFSVGVVRDGKMVTETALNEKFTDRQLKLIRELKIGEKLYIEDIRVYGSDNSDISLNGLIYTIN